MRRAGRHFGRLADPPQLALFSPTLFYGSIGPRAERSHLPGNEGPRFTRHRTQIARTRRGESVRVEYWLKVPRRMVIVVTCVSGHDVSRFVAHARPLLRTQIAAMCGAASCARNCLGRRLGPSLTRSRGGWTTSDRGSTLARRLHLPRRTSARGNHESWETCSCRPRALNANVLLRRFERIVAHCDQQPMDLVRCDSLLGSLDVVRCRPTNRPRAQRAATPSAGLADRPLGTRDGRRLSQRCIASPSAQFVRRSNGLASLGATCATPSFRDGHALFGRASLAISRRPLRLHVA